MLHALLGLLLAKMGLDWVLGIHGEVDVARLKACDVRGRWIVLLGLGATAGAEVWARLLDGRGGKELVGTDGGELGRGGAGGLPELHLHADLLLLLGRDGGLLDGKEARRVLRPGGEHGHGGILALGWRETHVRLRERLLGGLRRILDERRRAEPKRGHPILSQQVRADVGVHWRGSQRRTRR